jgi:hypothetical protein
MALKGVLQRDVARGAKRATAKGCHELSQYNVQRSARSRAKPVVLVVLDTRI